MINPLLTSGLVHPCHLDESISSLGVSGECLTFYCILHEKSCKQKSVDLDQTTRFAASGLGLHQLHIPLPYKRISNPKRINHHVILPFLQNGQFL